jgi:hypothetical protein
MRPSCSLGWFDPEAHVTDDVACGTIKQNTPYQGARSSTTRFPEIELVLRVETSISLPRGMKRVKIITE